MHAIEHYQFIRQLKNCPFIDAIYLYGSRARGDHRDRSDIDLAIQCPMADHAQWLHILDLIEEADTLLSIDVIRLDKLPKGRFKENILSDKKVIYRRESSDESSKHSRVH